MCALWAALAVLGPSKHLAFLGSIGEIDSHKVPTQPRV